MLFELKWRTPFATERFVINLYLIPYSSRTSFRKSSFRITLMAIFDSAISVPEIKICPPKVRVKFSLAFSIVPAVKQFITVITIIPNAIALPSKIVLFFCLLMFLKAILIILIITFSSYSAFIALTGCILSATDTG